MWTILKNILSFFSRIFLFTGKLEKNGFERRLSPAEEKVLFEKLVSAKARGETDPEAEEKLIKHNLRLVAHISKKYKSNFSDQSDLISIGSIGLIKAVRKFDPGLNKAFSSFASRCIENEILMQLRSEKKYAGETSLDAPIGTDKDGNELSLADIIPEQNESPEITLENNIRREMLEKTAKRVLTDREYEIFVNRYGLNGLSPRTQIEVAVKLNISRSYVSRIEKEAVAKITAEMNSNKI